MGDLPEARLALQMFMMNREKSILAMALRMIGRDDLAEAALQ